MEILRKGGIHNIVKIFESEADLLRTAEELVAQAQGLGAGPAHTAAPQTEFDQLRSEIGSAFDSGMAASPRRPAAPAMPPTAMPPTAMPPTAMPSAGAMNEFFTAANQQQFQAPANEYSSGISAARFPQPQQFTPPPLPAGGGETRQMPVVHEATSYQPQEDDGIQVQRPNASAAENFEETMVMPRSRSPIVKEAEPEAIENLSAKPPVQRDRFEDEFNDAPKKRNLAPVIIAIVVVLLGAGGFFGYRTFVKSKDDSSALRAGSAVEGVATDDGIPQLPVEGQAGTSAVPPLPEEPEALPNAEVEKAVVPAEKPEPVRKEAAVAPALQKKPVRKSRPVEKVAETERVRPVAAPLVRQSRPVQPPPAPKKTVQTDDPFADLPPLESSPRSQSKIEVYDEPAPARPAAPPAVPAYQPPPEPVAPSASDGGEAASVFIASIPPVADIYLDGKLVGKTNISELKVTAGAHTLRFVKGDKETSRQMTFQPGKNPSQMIRIQ